MSLFFLYRKAHHEIGRRKAVEKTLRESDDRYRYIYHNAPAMLHSINKEGRLVRVSDHWLKALGYTRKEVIGQKLIRFLSEASGRYANETIIPDFSGPDSPKTSPIGLSKKMGGRSMHSFPVSVNGMNAEM